MGFMDAYKNLEKLCCEIYGQPNGVSAYIDEMTETSGFYYVKGWNEDLKNLKHYRWVRNKISHEPDCSEANMCEPCDTVWIECFYERIMNQSDPLTLYQKSLVAKKTAASRIVQPPQKPVAANSCCAGYAHSPSRHKKRSKRVGYFVFLILVFLLIIAAFILYKAHLF